MTAVGALFEWLLSEWPWADGTCTLRGIDLAALMHDDAEKVTNVLLVLACEWLGAGTMASPRHVMDLLVDALNAKPSPADDGDASTLTAWGTSPEAQQGQAALMQLV